MELGWSKVVRRFSGQGLRSGPKDIEFDINFFRLHVASRSPLPGRYRKGPIALHTVFLSVLKRMELQYLFGVKHNNKDSLKRAQPNTKYRRTRKVSNHVRSLLVICCLGFADRHI
jgi:hypothetical protein